MANETKEKCFIITPIGEKTDSIRRHIDGIINEAIIPALSDKYEVKAAHHISEPGTITKQVIDAIYNSKLVVANLTGRNPNVMYELALRHAIGKPVIMIVEEGTKIPSDIVMQRIIPYFNDAMGTKELRDNLKKAESEISFDEKSGPIVEVLGDISHDADMLQKVAAKNSDSMEPLEYIMRRLDRIEHSLDTQAFTSDFITERETSRFVLRYTTDEDSTSELPSTSTIYSAARATLEEYGCRLRNIDQEPNKITFIVTHPSHMMWGNVASRLHRAMERIGLSFDILEKE